MFFLLTAISQFVPAFRVGLLFTYWLPLGFVLALSMGKEAFDDIKRFIQDRNANSQQYRYLNEFGELVPTTSSEIKVGQIIYIETDTRVPADIALLWTSEKTGTSFIRTDQLDGETDWKLKRSVGHTQQIGANSISELAKLDASFCAEPPKKDIYDFVGKVTFHFDENKDVEEPLSVDNMIWANTVVATGRILGMVIYTGPETRSALNRNVPETKMGHTDLEVNRLTKVLFILLLVLSIVMEALQRFSGLWFVSLLRFVILFSSIIPISMRVNIDCAKLVYSFFILHDKKIPGTLVRNSNLPEELGRISYLLSDKTGTLTQNEMVFKKLHVGVICYRSEDIDEIRNCVVTEKERISALKQQPEQKESCVHENCLQTKPREQVKHQHIHSTSVVKSTRGITGITVASIRAAAICHNVTPVKDDKTEKIVYQASSPDEVALVEFTESVGVRLVERDVKHMVLSVDGITETYEILELFPFSSATKRMGIIVKGNDGEIIFYIKGADTVMERLIKKDNSEWMREETDNMAREGLRTLVFGRKTFTQNEYAKFSEELHGARCSLVDRDALVRQVVEKYETGLTMLSITGVEDKLQPNVRSTLEMLGNAGIKTWMLTGDKVETATCIALSSRLFKPTDRIYTLSGVNSEECFQKLTDFRMMSACLVVDGATLQICLEQFPEQFIEAARNAPAVVCCRCSPTQKAEIVRLIKKEVGEITCAIGDGGNDVSMILAADVGIGLEGKEGKQASLAADYSLTQFQHLSRLLLWHGRNSYKRSCNISQFVIHRGFIISIIQFVFSIIFHFAAVAIYQGWLTVGYVTYYTMLPVFSLVLDQDVRDSVAMKFPELYSELRKGRQLGLGNFFMWVLISIYQGAVIMLLTMFFFETNLSNIVGITFTSLVMTELINMLFVVHTWTWPLVAAEMFTVMMYFISMMILPSYFDLAFITSSGFWWHTAIIVFIGAFPVIFLRFIFRKIKPPTYSKVNTSMRATGFQINY